MVSYCKNVETGKYHKITVNTWTEADYDPEPLDEMPEGFIFGGLFVIKDNTVHFLPGDKIIPIENSSIKNRQK